MPPAERFLGPFLRYCGVGAVNTIADLAVFLVLNAALRLSVVPANIASYGCGMMVSFLLNRRFTFRHANYALGAASQLLRFILVNLLALCLSTALVYGLARILPAPLAKLASIPAVVAWGFLGARAFVFRPLPSLAYGSARVAKRAER